MKPHKEKNPEFKKVQPMKEKLNDIELALIDRPFEPHRQRIDPEKIRELAESIREIGLQEPIILRPLNGRYEVVAGDRRVLAFKFLSRERIPAIIREMDEETLVLVRATENLQRENLSPMEEARVYGNMRDKLGMSFEKIAKRTGRACSTVRKYLDLLDVPEKWQEAVDRKSLAIEAALCLARIDDPEMRDFYFAAAVDNGVTIDVARRWLEDYRKSKVGQFEPDAGGGGGAVGGVAPTLVYQTCFGCDGPVESRQVRYVPLCPHCHREVLKGKETGEGR